MNARNAIRLRALSCGCALIVAVLAASGVANLFREDRPERDVNVVTFRTDLSQTVAVFTTSIVTLADRGIPSCPDGLVRLDVGRVWRRRP